MKYIIDSLGGKYLLILLSVLLLASCTVPGLEDTSVDKQAECKGFETKIIEELNKDFNIDVIGGEVTVDELFYSYDKESCFIVYSYDGDGQKSTFLITHEKLFSVQGLVGKENIVCKSRIDLETNEYIKDEKTCSTFEERVNSYK